MDAPGIAAQLKTNPVYVADGLPATTSSDISALLSSTDGIKVVVLDQGQAVGPLAKQVLTTQPEGTVLIVASGNDVTAVGNAMPAGALADLLSRAQNVSTNGTDTVRTLVGNLHDYQAAHPQTITATQQPDPVGAFLPVGAVGLPVVLAVVASVIIFHRRSRRLSSQVKGTGPREIRPLIGDLMEARLKIHNQGMRTSIETLCMHVEAYFKRVKNDDMARQALRTQLRDAVLIARTYADVEEHSVYYNKPTTVLAEGRAGIDGLSVSVLASVRSSNARSLVDYTVNTKILSAQKYR